MKHRRHIVTLGALAFLAGLLAVQPVGAVSFGPSNKIQASLAPVALSSAAPYSVNASTAPLTLGTNTAPAAAALADGTANPTTTLLGGMPHVWNGLTWDRARSGSASNLSANSAAGAQVICPPGAWSNQSFPSANTQATATKAAGGAGVRHVCTSICAAITCDGGVASHAALYLRDGASGSGAVLWSCTVGVPGTNGQTNSIAISNLNIVGSSATALCLEFFASAGASTYESVAMTGYDAQ